MKRQRRTTAQVMDVGEDRISELPDPILHHILSLLPTKLSVSTTVLSKRWKDLWTSLPVLDFREWLPDPCHGGEEERFMDFMDRILSLHDSPIKKIYLDCDDYDAFDDSRVRAWIENVIRRKVEVLDLAFRSRFMCQPLPPCFFTCESLSELNLVMVHYLKLPESISFPRLKILRLSYVIFAGENLTQQFFSNCPVLEDLTLEWCIWEDMNVIPISAPALKLLEISHLNENSGVHNCVIKIYAPSLLSFTHDSYLAEDYVFSGFSSLVDADIHFKPWRYEEGYGANNLLRGISNVKHLHMTGKSFKTLSKISGADGRLSNLLTFCNLIHLVVSWFRCLVDRTLFNFLQMAPNLESLVFTKGFCHLSKSHQPNCNWTIDLIPRCLVLHLKSVKFQGFDGSPCMLNVIELFLKNASVLQKMTIQSSLTLSRGVKEQLLMLPRGSTGCVIKFSTSSNRRHSICAKAICGTERRAEHGEQLPLYEAIQWESELNLQKSSLQSDATS